MTELDISISLIIILVIIGMIQSRNVSILLKKIKSSADHNDLLIKKLFELKHQIKINENEIEFQKQLNKTLSEGLEAFTKKSKK